MHASTRDVEDLTGVHDVISASDSCHEASLDDANALVLPHVHVTWDRPSRSETNVYRQQLTGALARRRYECDGLLVPRITNRTLGHERPE
jgi:hypothetical protein